jgi:general secretion pathway protein F
VPAYEYVVLDSAGKQKKGVLEGDSPRHVRQQLKEKGLVPLSVEATAQKAKREEKNVFRRGSMSSADLALVTRQLATLVRAGIPIEGALRAVSKQSEKPRVASIMLAIRSRVVEGHSLESALSEFPQAFPDLYRATVGAGEHSGHLDLVLEQLSDYTESRHRTQRTIQGAMIYPIVLTAFAVLIVVGMLVFVVPKIVTVFESSGQQLPLLTRILIGSSDFLQGWWWAILAVMALMGWLWQRAMTKPAFRFRVHRRLLVLPLLGKIVRGIESARVIGTLAILSRSGVPLVDALRISAQVAGNLPIRESVGEAATKLREGSSLFTALDACGYFPPMMMQMIASGESSGELDSMLTRAAQNQERELEEVIATIVGLFEPIMLVVMGGVVLTIVLSIMMPVISMNTLVK